MIPLRNEALLLVGFAAAIGIRTLLPRADCAEQMPALAAIAPPQTPTPVSHPVSAPPTKQPAAPAPAQAPAQTAPTTSPSPFKPSQHGFHFRNSFSGSPLPAGLSFLSSIVSTPSRFGLCGGMSSAAADFFLAGRQPPDILTPPTQGDPLYEYLWRRQVDSMGANFSMVPVYAHWMGKREEGPFGTNHLTSLALPVIKEHLAAGKPLVIGLVLTSSSRGEKIWDNHQVLAIGSTTVGPTTTIRLYDSNHPFNDDVTLTTKTTYAGSLPLPGPLGIAIPVLAAKTTFRAKPTTARPNGVTMNVRGFFEMPYAPVVPPADLK